MGKPTHSQRIRVAHLTSVHIPFDTRIFYKELKSLLKAGYDVVLIATHERDEVVEGVRVRSVPKPKGRLERMFLTTWRVLRIAWQEDADVYHVHDPELLPWVQILRLRGKIVIFDMHENVPKQLRTKLWINPIIRRVVAFSYRLVERILLWRMPVILVFAEHSSHLAEYQWIDRRHVTILNMPMTDELLQISEPRYSHPTVGFIGTPNPNRGTLITLEALQILQADDFPVEWDCIGPLRDGHRDEMETFIRTNALQGVRLHGYMLPGEGYRIIARCHIGLSVLTPIPSAIDSYPTKMFEYMALGIPVIASGFPLYREIIESAECGLCLDDPTNPQELADAIRWLIDHPQEAEAMGKRGRKAAAQHYNWEVEAEKLRTFYHQLQGESGNELNNAG